jgi:hypothetical protein
VADHGKPLFHLKELTLAGKEASANVELYFPLLLVKDFNSKGFTVSEEFMTNADVPSLATAQLIEQPVNPFTGKPINADEKTAHDQMVIRSFDWDVNINNGNTFLPSTWASVKDNLWDPDNWIFSEVETVLAEHKLP